MDAHQNHSPVWNTLLGLTAALGLVTAVLVYHRATVWPHQFASSQHTREKVEHAMHDKQAKEQLVETTTNIEVQPKKEEKPAALESEGTIAMTGSRYYLIVGSFAQEKNADELKATLTQKGHSAEVLPVQGTFRVSIFSDPAYSVVVNKQASLSEFESAWIVKQ